MTLLGAGLLQSGFAWAADWARPDRLADSSAEAVPTPTGRAANAMSSGRPTAVDYRSGDDSDEVVGQNEEPQGMFGDGEPPACEFCGGGNCVPAPWSLDAAVSVIGTSKANSRTLGINSLPGGPFQVTSGSIATQPLQFAFFNNVSNTLALNTHTPNLSDSAGLDTTISRYLGRDGEKRDYFLQFEFSGLERFYGESSVEGTIVPVFSTTATTGVQTSSGTIDFFTGSLISPFQFPNSPALTPFQPNLTQNYDPRNAYAFNGATHMEVSTWSTFNNWEVNLKVAGNNQPDQMVLNPNGHWYRQCKTGYFYSYLFGLRAMVIDEKYEFNASGMTFDPNMNPILTSSGRYVARTTNALLGLQTGGTLEYRFCRWELEAHSKVGMYVNVANQNSLIQTSLHGIEYFTPGQPAVDADTSTAFNAGQTGIAFAGGFGVGGSYKLRPNLVAHVSYDMFWVGDLARASDQFDFVPVISPVINMHGNQFYDGVKFGLECDW
jgi:hypothetical protein